MPFKDGVGEPVRTLPVGHLRSRIQAPGRDRDVVPGGGHPRHAVECKAFGHHYSQAGIHPGLVSARGELRQRRPALSRKPTRCGVRHLDRTPGRDSIRARWHDGHASISRAEFRHVARQRMSRSVSGRSASRHRPADSCSSKRLDCLTFRSRKTSPEGSDPRRIGRMTRGGRGLPAASARATIQRESRAPRGTDAAGNGPGHVGVCLVLRIWVESADCAPQRAGGSFASPTRLAWTRPVNRVRNGRLPSGPGVRCSVAVVGDGDGLRIAP